MKIGFSVNHASTLSQLIQRVTVSRWSHIFLITGHILSENDYVVYEATGQGVGKSWLSKYQDNQHEYQIFEVADTDNDISAIYPILGTQYGYIQLIGIALAKLFKSTWNIFTKNAVCSEVVCRWLQASKYAELFKDFNPDYVSPEDLYRRILQYPDIFKEVKL